MQHWSTLAACKGLDPQMFFPGSGQNDLLELARAVCNGCSVKQQCLNENLHEEFGVWGGTSERQRRILRRQRKGNLV